MNCAKLSLNIVLISCLIFIANVSFAQKWQAGSLTPKKTLPSRLVTKSLKVRWTPEAELVEKTVAIVDGKVILEGDIVLGSEQEIFNNSRGVVTNIGAQRWPNSTIPYVIAADHEDVVMVQAAINMIIRGTNICMIPRTTETDYVEFVNSNFCTSQIGRQGGRQEIEASATCGVGVTAHEILHAAGHFHEQSRSDRDDYVTINLENVVPGLEFNFEKATVGTDIGTYDYHSIMHYRPFDFSTNGLPTVEVISPGANPPNIGQSTVLSEGNISTTNTIYPSQPNCSLIPIVGNLNFQTAGTLTVSGTSVTLSNMVIENNGNSTIGFSNANFLVVGSDGSFAVLGTLFIPPLDPGETFNLNAFYNLNNFDFVPAGTYRFAIFLNQTGATIEATPKDNLHRWNTATATKQAITCPDLAISELTVSNYSSNTISFNYKYKNIGTATADVSGPTFSLNDNANIKIAFSADRIFDAADQLLTEVPIPFNVFANAISTGSKSFSGINLNTATHPYLVLQIDENNLVNECNESNNDFAVRIAPIQTTCTHPDFAALAAIYNATNGDNWEHNFNWDATGQTSCDPCQDNWSGVECENGRVTELHLEVNNLTGTIPAEIGNLNNLSILYLSGNQLSGCLPNEMTIFCELGTTVEIENNPNLEAGSFSQFCSNNTGNCNGSGNTPPSNDNCSTAIALTVNATCSGNTYNNAYATISPNEIPFDCGVSGELKDVWFTATVPNTGNLTIETYDVTNGLTDMVMQTYIGACSDLIKLVCNDDIDFENSLTHSKIVLTNQTPNTTIYIRVIAYNNEDTGDFGICAYDDTPQISCQAPTNKRITHVADSYVTASWDAVDHANTYDLRYRIVGFTQWFFVNNITTNIDVTIPEINQTFEWQVRTNCTDGSTSDWSTLAQFDYPPSTDCADLSIAQLSINDYTTNSISFNYVYKNNGTVAANINYPNTKITTVISQDMYYDASDIVISSNPLFADISAGGIVSGATAVSNSSLQINPAVYPYFILEIDSDNHIVECDESNNTYVLRIDECSNDNTMSLSNNLTNGFYTAQATINGNCVIGAGKDVQMQAANSITLSPGFHAKAGANLSISIGNNCDDANIVNAMTNAQPQSANNFKENDWKNDGLTVEVFPNPIQDFATLRYYHKNSREIQLLVSNLNGQIVKQQTLVSEMGWNELNLDMNAYPSGTYFVHLLTPNQQIHKKIMVID